jgi:hypothetical protein
MSISDNLAGAGLTVAFPLATLGVVVLWFFFDRKPGATFGGLSKSSSEEAAGRPEIKPLDAGVERDGGGVQTPLS